MTNCCLSTFRGIWSFLMGSLRMILFFMCLLYVLGTLVSFAGLFFAESSPELKDLPDFNVKFTDYLHVVALLLLGLLGTYGSFYKHHPSVRSFSLLSALNTLLLTFLLLYTMAPDDIREQRNRTFIKFKQFMPNYKWDHSIDPFDSNGRQATRAWDGLQKLACCGIEGPLDWAKYRPSGGEYKNAYPGSCCFKTSFAQTLCTEGDMLFTQGCNDKVTQIQDFSFMLYCGVILYQLALSIIAYMVGSCTVETRHQPRQAMMGMSAQRGPTLYVDQHYQQPPVNPVYVDHPPPKQSLPPMYPNLHGSTTNYSQPPPSYGT